MRHFGPQLNFAPVIRLRVAIPLGVLFGVMLQACGGTSPGAERSITGSEPPSSLLQRWGGFPVAVSPRPVVLAGSPVVAPSKFPDGDTKLAFITGAFDLPAQLPSGPATSDGYPVIGAAAAVAVLRSQPHASSSPGSTASPAAKGLQITAGDLSTAMFTTDRGDLALPAWLFALAGIDEPVRVLAVSPAAQWSPPGLVAASAGASFVNGATIGSDNRTLTAGLIGAPSGTGPCTASYDLRLTESTTAVVVTVIEHSHNSAMTACTAVGYPRTATAKLATPLGARVVLDAVTGQPVAVTGQR
jgi:hypothetical protein